ncbi:hypothetical protein SEVIR_4G067902v4 [Setaria viridis]|uniref:Secreted protein n=1 Tax=Setaria viridis TaxID=4556 RepID=A0A4U6UZ71_SETVI|nr:hypothetical protein SEVIR_4G067902v2 [Setaria viridis]
MRCNLVHFSILVSWPLGLWQPLAKAKVHPCNSTQPNPPSSCTRIRATATDATGYMLHAPSPSRAPTRAAS